MLLNEFISRVNYQPTASEWAEINNAYMHCIDDKDTFCRAWAKANPAKAGALRRAEAQRRASERALAKFVAWLGRVRKGLTPFVRGRRAVCEAAGILNGLEAWEHIMHEAWQMCERGEIRGFYLGGVDGEIYGCDFCPANYRYYSAFELITKINQ